MTPDQRLLLANDRIAALHAERDADRTAERSTRRRPSPPRTPLFAGLAGTLRRVVGAIGAVVVGQ